MSDSKINGMFSKIAHDQVREQDKKLLKNTYDLSRLNDEKRLIQWMVVGPEAARMIEEFEENHNLKSDIPSEGHHDDTASFCNRFQTHVLVLVEIFKGQCNFFEDRVLIVINSCRIVLPKECARAVILSNVIGKRKFEEFVQDRLLLRKISLRTS